MHESEFLDWAIKGILAASFAGWAFIIKYFGGKYVSSLDGIQEELAKMRLDIAVLKAQVAKEKEE